MQTVFSHIVQKRLSQENENVATEAFAFILKSHEAARNGMIKLLRGVDPQIPRLWFRTQQNEGNNRPDMHGNDDEGETHIFIENKFWAGLTENQPVSYLRILAACTKPTILLVIGPENRQETLWRELNLRLCREKIIATEEKIVGVFRIAQTDIGPILALTSWKALLDALELQVADDKTARNDLIQLQSLCTAADSGAFLPISSEEISDQRTPALILQLSSIVQAVVDLSVTKGILNLKGTMPQASTERIGRYAYFGEERRSGPWLGIHFSLWKKHGLTPLWIVFPPGDWGRANEVRALLEPWAAHERVLATIHEDGSFVVALDIAPGEDKDRVVEGIVDRLKKMADYLAALKPRSESKTNDE